LPQRPELTDKLTRIARGLLEAGDDDEVTAGTIKAERLGAPLSADG
jgi:hypothetical protein